MTRARAPAVAGQFYERSGPGLESQIEELFTHEHGPGEVPAVSEDRPDVRALVSPHAGFPYSGPVAAHGFAELASSGTPEAAIILGPNHDGRGDPAALSAADVWETPLGEIPIHEELRDRIHEESEVITTDERTHNGEHSIEVQVPFLQYLYGDRVSIVPICLTRQDQETVSAVTEAITRAVEGFDRNVVLVASTDLTHYQPQGVAEKQDRKAIEKMEALDASGLLETVSRENLSMCGYGPTAAVLEGAKSLGTTEGALLKYATSGETAGPSREVVGYASVVGR